MASRTLTSARTSRTSLDQERENFERTQMTAIVKAVSETEAPVKAKHVRSAIIGTFQEKSSQTFWSIIMRLPLQSSPILAWKFCHTLHKLLREGHHNTLQDSMRHRDLLIDTGKMWGHLKDGYGKLICLYCRLLIVKLDFHRKNPRFPGNMAMRDEELEAVCENDINNYFQLSVELFDYMDEILMLQGAVFGSLDMSRSNSMTNAGQCRLAPLIPCIQDSSHIYDFVVKLLFRLHNSLSPDTLVGHRDRFVKQYKALKQFYLQSSTLQYFKTLITVPRLEENPPNFLISSDLGRHVTPVVIVPSEPPPQTEGTLVTFDTESSVDGSERNGSISPDLLVERDRYIEHLLHQIEQMTAEMNRIRAESQRQVDSLRQNILDLELRLAEKDSELQEAIQGREDIERKLSEAAKSAQLGSVVQLQLQEAEKRAKGIEEKFAKLKEVYQKLRDEHINLLRQKAETDKKLGVTSSALEQSNKLNSELQESLEHAKTTAKEATDELETLKSSQDDKVQVLITEKQELATLKEQLQTKCVDVEQQVKTLESQLSELSLERENLSKDKTHASEELTAVQTALEQAQSVKAELEKSLEQSKNIIEGMTTELATLKSTQDEKVLELCGQKEEMESVNQQLRQSLEQAEKSKTEVDQRLNELQTQHEDLQQQKAQIDQKLAESNEVLEQSRQTVAELQLSLQTAESNVRQVTEDLQSARKQNEEVAQRFADEKVQWEDVNHRLKETLQGVEQQVKQLDGQISDLQQQKEELIRQSGESDVQHQMSLKTKHDETIKLLQALLVECSVKAEEFMHKSVHDLSRGPAGSLTVQDRDEMSTHEALSRVDGFAQALHVHCSRRGAEDEGKATSQVIPLIFPLAQSVGLTLLQGQQLAHTLTNIERADQVLAKCSDCGKTAAGFFKRLQNPQLQDGDVDAQAEQVRTALRALDSLLVDVISEMKGAPVDEQDLEKELALMEQAIEEAAQRIAQLWDRSKQSHSGVKLEVNGKILDSCTSLMAAIIQLIKKAKTLQEEIVAQGKGSASAKEFYKRNHHWTEGLLSAAKAVGFGAKLLTDAADKVVQGQAKFEQLTVASQEISASTAQLVFASRVKADRGSKNLQGLTDASKAVTNATGSVVAAAKHCAELVEESNVLDFGHLSLHQAKRLEMESQVKVLELESSLQKERLRLAALRRQHYQLAGESAPDS